MPKLDERTPDQSVDEKAAAPPPAADPKDPRITVELDLVRNSENERHVGCEETPDA
jgi:hypothetical protein